jgi:hypothetical protein
MKKELLKVIKIIDYKLFYKQNCLNIILKNYINTKL